MFITKSNIVVSFVGKLKQPIPTRVDIQKVEWVKAKVPIFSRVYPKFIFTANLIKARLIDLSESKCLLYRLLIQ